MKKTITVTSLALAFALSSCSNVDKGLVQEMQQAATTAEAMKPTTESTAQSVADFKNKVLAEQNVAVKNGAAVMSQQIELKYNRILEEYNAIQSDLKTLTSEYEGGKAKTEAASVRFTELKGKLTDIETGMKKLKEVTERPLTELAEIGNQIAKSQGTTAATATTTTPSDAQGGNGTSDSGEKTSPDAAPAKPTTGTINAPFVGDGTNKRNKQ